MATRMARVLTAGIFLAVIQWPPVAHASHGSRHGGFTAQALPAGWLPPGCTATQSLSSRSFKAPWNGILRLSMNGFEGDWDLYVYDESGAAIAVSANWALTGREKLTVALTGGESYELTGCNWMGSLTAEIRYDFIHFEPAATAPHIRGVGEQLRAQEEAYYEPAVGVAYPSYNMATCQTGCLVFDVYPDERFVVLEARDLASEDVALAVFPWDETSSGRYDEHHFCSSTDEPLLLPFWVTKIWVEVLIGPCSDGTPATATQGTVVATFFDAR